MKWNDENVVHRYAGCLKNRDNRKSGINERTGSCIRIDTRIVTILFMFFFQNGWSINVFICIENFPKRKKKKIHPQLISHIKNISMGLWLHKERKHTYNIQICTSCMWAEISKFTIYTRTQVLAISTQIQAQCNSRSSVVSTRPGCRVQMIIYSPVTWESREYVEWWVLTSSAEDVFMQQCSAVTKTSVFASILCQALYTVSVTASLQTLLQERRCTKTSTLKNMCDKCSFFCFYLPWI